MGRLHDRMEQDLVLKGFSPATRRNYLLYCRKFAAHYRRSPQELGETEIRRFLLHLIQIELLQPPAEVVAIRAGPQSPGCSLPGRPSTAGRNGRPAPVSEPNRNAGISTSGPASTVSRKWGGLILYFDSRRLVWTIRPPVMCNVPRYALANDDEVLLEWDPVTSSWIDRGRTVGDSRA